MNRIKPPLKYLLCCSDSSLEGFELSRLNRIANLRKELSDLYEEWIEAEVETRLARWILDERRTPDLSPTPPPKPLHLPEFSPAPPHPHPPAPQPRSAIERSPTLKTLFHIVAGPRKAKNAP